VVVAIEAAAVVTIRVVTAVRSDTVEGAYIVANYTRLPKEETIGYSTIQN
jgi:hypothetical protein